jgi:uroporphyrinogen decarboxylase
MSKVQLSHRERVMLALNHRTTDRIPIAMVCSGINAPASKTLEDYLRRHRGIGVEEYLRPLIDIQDVGPAYVGPKRAEGTDIWGVHRSPVSYGEDCYTEIDYYPLAQAQTVDDILAHPWPDPACFDASVMPQRIAAANREGEYCLMIHNGNIFETAWAMRGFERMFVDLIDQPELARAIFEKVTCFFIDHFRAVLAASQGKVDLVFTADDIAGQNGLLMSLSMWQEHIKPYHVRMNKAIHECGARIIYHSDGAVMEAVPGLIDMGIDVLQALQFDAQGMDANVLKDRYGQSLCFEGGVSVQKTLPFAAPEDVRKEVIERIEVLGRGGGYILGPSHAIQAGTPPENIVAMFDTAAGFDAAL